MAGFGGAALDHARPVYSPIVRLEISCLHEIGRVTVPDRTILDNYVHAFRDDGNEPDPQMEQAIDSEQAHQ